MKLKLVVVGKLKDQNLLEKINFYRERLKPFVSLQIVEVKDFPFKKGMNQKVAVEKECEGIFEKLSDDDFYLALDEKGKQKTTEEWVETFRKWENSGRKEIIFIIGGAHGLSESILRGSRERLALSKLTFTHELARLIFLEQVYRVYTVMRGIPYHHV